MPTVSKKVCQLDYPSGLIGGGSPGDLWPYQYGVNAEYWGGMSPPRHSRSLYTSFWYRISPNFPVNLVANKVVYNTVLYGKRPVVTMFGASSDYPRVDANGYMVLDPFTGVMDDAEWHKRQYTAPAVPTICFQATYIDGVARDGCTSESWTQGTPWAQQTQVYRGVWHHFETLYILESPGQNDGSARLWLDGKLLINWDKRIRFIPTEATLQEWSGLTWGPVYGGGGSIAADMPGGYHQMKDFYTSGEPATARTRRTPVVTDRRPTSIPKGTMADTVFTLKPPPAWAKNYTRLPVKKKLAAPAKKPATSERVIKVKKP